MPESRFVADSQQIGAPGSVVFYSHRFTAGTAGTVAFSATNSPVPSFPGWSHVVFRDANGNARLDAGEIPVTSSIAVAAGESILVIVKEFIPPNAALNMRDQLTITAAFAMANAAPALNGTYACIDLTTVGEQLSSGLVLTKTVDKPTASPGETIEYVLNYTNQGVESLTEVSIHDRCPRSPARLDRRGRDRSLAGFGGQYRLGLHRLSNSWRQRLRQLSRQTRLAIGDKSFDAKAFHGVSYRGAHFSY